MRDGIIKITTSDRKMQKKWLLKLFKVLIIKSLPSAIPITIFQCSGKQSGILYNPPQNVTDEHPDLIVVQTYPSLKRIIPRISGEE